MDHHLTVELTIVIIVIVVVIVIKLYFYNIICNYNKLQTLILVLLTK